ncbi:MAG: hypothetical protein ACK56I_00555, partial [bacterium]
TIAAAMRTFISVVYCQAQCQQSKATDSRERKSGDCTECKFAEFGQTFCVEHALSGRKLSGIVSRAGACLVGRYATLRRLSLNPQTAGEIWTACAFPH